MEKKDQPGCWVIGDKDFIKLVMDKNKHRIRSVNILRKEWSIERVVKKIAEDHKLIPEDIKRRSRMSLDSQCRKKLFYICCRKLGYSLEEIAGYLGLSGPAISWAIKKGEKLVTQKYVSEFTNLPPGVCHEAK